MRIGDYLNQRRAKWNQLEQLYVQVSSAGGVRKMKGEQIATFTQLYRSVCSDLAMANENRLPPATASYLHDLIGRCHSQLYRTADSAPRNIARKVFFEAPHRILNDVCVQFCGVLFFGLFTLSALFAQNEEAFPKFANLVLGEESIDRLEESFAEPIGGRDEGAYVIMSAFYIQHNTSIGLRCFGEGILILPCLFELTFNAVTLGASFGYMARESATGGDNFMEFTTAHGPFELTAIVMSAAAGLRMGVGFFVTYGFRRFDSIRAAASDAVPLILAAVVLFSLAAFTEGCISPSPLPYIFKAFWAICSSTAMMIYFVVLGSLEGGQPDVAR